ncbi:MAG: stage II sporulation protein D [Clostridia bacterium]|nr:stage II sporulation protein D [Clostridia bacterium]MDD4386268.1 stage II sporulation protein D [Clostridia bacterium]
MKRWLVFFCILLFSLSIVLSIINKFIIDNTEKKALIKQEEKEEKQIIEYKANQTIRVKMCKTNEIIAMDINDYLRGVVASEMPAAYNIEALKAQAIVARTYTYRKMLENAEGPDVDMCDDFKHCQAFYNKEKLFSIWTNRGFDDSTRIDYWNKVNEAVISTQNQVITYNGEYIKAFFHASSPIKTENIDQIWGGIKIPYLVSVDNVEYENYPNRNSEVIVAFSDFEKQLEEQIDDNFKLSNIDDLKEKIKINSYTTSGRVKDIKVGNLIVSSEKLRTLFGLKSTQFEVNILDEGISFKVIGYGHGIGMSQVGANYMADNGKSCLDIIKYYYTGVDIITIK